LQFYKQVELQPIYLDKLNIAMFMKDIISTSKLVCVSVWRRHKK